MLLGLNFVGRIVVDCCLVATVPCIVLEVRSGLGFLRIISLYGVAL